MQKSMARAVMTIKACRSMLTRQQYKTVKGQALAGDIDGALRGLRRLLSGNG